MEVKINIKPLSVNQCWRGRRFKTESYKSYEIEMLYKLPKQQISLPPYKIVFELGLSNVCSDWDNPIKPLQDILQKKYSFNDKDVYEAIIRKVIVKKGSEYIFFSIKSIKI